VFEGMGIVTHVTFAVDVERANPPSCKNVRFCEFCVPAKTGSSCCVTKLVPTDVRSANKPLVVLYRTESPEVEGAVVGFVPATPSPITPTPPPKSVAVFATCRPPVDHSPY
jgi:hypothetical protein